MHVSVIWFYRCVCEHLFASGNEYDNCPQCGADCESFDWRVDDEMTNDLESKILPCLTLGGAYTVAEITWMALHRTSGADEVERALLAMVARGDVEQVGGEFRLPRREAPADQKELF